jgi:hypothetical protein
MGTETGYGDKDGIWGQDRGYLETDKEIWRQRRRYGDRGGDMGDREVR